MRTVEIISGDNSVWTIEVQDELEHRIASSLGRGPYGYVSDEEIKDYFLNAIMAQREILSLEVVKS